MNFITKLNWVDIVVIIIVLRTTYVAIQDGLSHEIIPLLGAFSALSLSISYYSKMAYLMSQGAGIVPISLLKLVSFVLIFTVIGIVFKFIRAIFDKIVKVTWHPAIEKFGGLLTGFLKASMITSAILIMLAMTPLPYLKWSVMDRSFIGTYFVRIGPSIYSETARILPALKNRGLSPEDEDIVQGMIADRSEKAKVKKEAMRK